LAVVVLLGAAVSAGMFALLVGGLFPAWHAARIRDARRTCSHNLRRIGEALREYEADYGCLPPASLAGADGKPAHSWRVLLLPYLGQQGLYDRYDFSQPWDSPHNAVLSSRMPEVFGCPADAESLANNESSYVVVVGPRAAFLANRGRLRAEISDDPATTVLVVESPVTGINWLEPRDISMDRFDPSINGRLGQSAGSFHPEGAHVLTADDSVRYLSNKTPSDITAAAFTIDGGEGLAADALSE
jgi:hypothetical protein